MDIAFHVFSGTGNTLMVCNYMKEKLEEYGNKVVAFSKIKKGELYSSSSDCIIIAYPVHAFNAPLPIINLALHVFLGDLYFTEGMEKY